MKKISQRSNRAHEVGMAISAMALVTLLTACGGGGSKTNYFEPGGDDGSDGAGGTGGTPTAPTTGTGGVSIGAIMDGTFVQGELDVAVDTLSAGGTTEVTVNLVDQNGDPYSEVATIAFSSRCASDGTATLETGLDTVGGQAVAEYISNGCVGDDEIRATTTINGQSLVARGSVFVEQEDIGSLEFVSADPPQIALAGTGGDETSRVTFRLVGEAGGPVQNATVGFSLNSTTGGLSLTADSAITNKDGEVSTVVRAGTIATSVRVTATETSTDISTQSSQLVVSTGIPDSDSFSLAVDVLNPDAWNYDGTEVTFTARAADAFNNPVPDGTAVSFYSEGGAIDPSCTTVNGACSVTWRSQNPRTSEVPVGRTTIIATAIGNESFTDANGNGRFEDDEAFVDLPEAFANVDESSDPDTGAPTYQQGEFFVDFGPGGSPNGSWDDADGRYNGVLCLDNNSALCSPDHSLIVSRELIIVMSSDVPSALMLFTNSDNPNDPATATPHGTLLDLSQDGPFDIRVADHNENAMPIDTTVTLGLTDGFEFEGTSSYTVPNTTVATFFPVAVRIVQEDSATETGGTFTVTTTTPRGVSYTYSWPFTL